MIGHKRIHTIFLHLWYTSSIFTYFLLPFSWLFQIIVQIRVWYYHFKQPTPCRVPVIVVGNITVGGTGKTPVVIALATFLKAQGYQPGIVMRGFQAHFKGTSRAVFPSSDPWEAGEEGVLLARATACPVMIGKRRKVAAEALLEAYPQVDVIISDDGLQHYAMPRDIEILVVDKKRLWGNGFCLPAGPLREPISRIKSVDYVMVQDGHLPGALTFHKKLSDKIVAVNREANILSSSLMLSQFMGKKVHAVAGIGDPNLFFTQLTALGIQVIPHAFPDHYWFTQNDLIFEEEHPILMTEKDAIKCAQFTHQPLWAVPLIVEIPAALKDNLVRRLRALTRIDLINLAEAT